MSFAWLFSAEAPLPSGHTVVVLHNESTELGARRLAEAARVLGEREARDRAEKLGAYELDEESVRRLENAGSAPGASGEFPALSPGRWVGTARADDADALESRLAGGDELAGVLLTESQRESFLRFLTRNHEQEAEGMAPERALRLARHFFFQEPVVAVVRHTAPRFART